jgi:hypothetical protein
MRVYQGGYQSDQPFSDYRDVVLSDKDGNAGIKGNLNVKGRINNEQDTSYLAHPLVYKNFQIANSSKTRPFYVDGAVLGGSDILYGADINGGDKIRRFAYNPILKQIRYSVDDTQLYCVDAGEVKQGSSVKVKPCEVNDSDKIASQQFVWNPTLSKWITGKNPNLCINDNKIDVCSASPTYLIEDSSVSMHGLDTISTSYPLTFGPNYKKRLFRMSMHGRQRYLGVTNSTGYGLNSTITQVWGDDKGNSMNWFTHDPATGKVLVNPGDSTGGPFALTSNGENQNITIKAPVPGAANQNFVYDNVRKTLGLADGSLVLTATATGETVTMSKLRTDLQNSNQAITIHQDVDDKSGAFVEALLK